MNYIITEEKSISQEVKNIAEQIINTMVQDSVNVSMKLNDADIAYKENTITVEFDNENIEPITLEYTVYYADEVNSVKEVYASLRTATIDINCSYDNLERLMKIVTVNDNGYLEENFYGSVLHEVNHMFQYDKGMEKRVDLYDLILRIISDRNSTRDEVYTARCLYYTFAHEQDAFTHQFYGFLKEKPDEISFEDALNEFDTFQEFKTLRSYVSKNHKNPSAQRTIRRLGFDNRTYIQRIQFGWQRLKRKLKNAYFLYLKELNESKNIRRNHADVNFRSILREIKLYELYGENINIAESDFRKIKKELLD